MLHEFETDRRAPTAPKDDISSVLFGTIGALILAMITFLECIHLLTLFPAGMRTHSKTLYMGVWLGPERKPTTRALAHAHI
jgi:hypothetical protein